ncbi:MAG: efflux RND transporter permease subunit [Rhodospirillales bacterium]
MIEAVIRWSIRNRGIVLMLALAVAGWGLWSSLRTPVDAIPDLSDVQVIVKVTYPGQAPQIVEDQVTFPISTAMLSVPRATTVRGFSFFNDSFVYILFEEGTDLYWARSRVQEQLARITGDLPAEARVAMGPDATGVGWIFQYALVDRTGERDAGELRAIQDWFLRLELLGTPGVAEVATIGGMVRQYQVVADPDLLRGYGLTLADLRTAIGRANAETGGSVIEMAEAEYMVRAGGYIASLEDLRAIPLRTTARGTPLRLGDVAEIRHGPALRRGVGEFDGEGEAVGGVIVMRWGENAREVIRLVRERLAALQAGLPAGVEIVPTYDRSGLIDRAVSNLRQKLAEEMIVVILVIAAFLLHLRSSAVILLSLPLGVLAAVGVMHLQGINANIMSLGGIAIAIGTMVDAAIVMIESLHRKLEHDRPEGEARWRLVAEAASEVGPALFFSLVIIAVSFLPIFALEAQEGRLFKPLAYTKTYAMAAAAILSVTLVPVLMGYFVRGRIIRDADNPLNRALMWLYRPAIAAVIAAPRAVVAIAVLVALSTVYPLKHLGSEFMPDLDEGDFLYMPTLFPSVSIGKVGEVLGQMNRLIKTVPEVKTVHAKAGRAETATDPAPLAMIETVVQLKPRSEWRPGMTMDRIRAELDRAVQIPGVNNVWIMPIKNRIDMLATGVRSDLGIRVTGPDLAGIGAITAEIEQLIGGIEGTASAFAERVVGGRYIAIDVDREEAARFGLNIEDVHDVVRFAVGGADVTETVEGRARFPVNLRFPWHVRNSPEALAALPIVTPSRAQIPLADVATVSLTDGPGMIRTENARLAGWVHVSIAGRDLGGYVDEARRLVAERVALPPGYAIEYAGRFQFLERARERLAGVLPATVAIIVFLLFMAFRRTADVLMVATSLPVALAGGAWLIHLLGFNVSVAVVVGFIALAGVAVETAVIMLIYLNLALERHRRTAAAEGRMLARADLEDAVREGAILRLRPKMMTVVTIFAGLMPLMIGTGTGAEVMQRIAAPMVGGMVTATLLTLLVIPAAFLLWHRRGLGSGRRSTA